MNEISNMPKMMTVREIAATGLLPENNQTYQTQCRVIHIHRYN